jgi:hypothetical protein
MAFAPGGDAEKMTEGVQAHGMSSLGHRHTGRVPLATSPDARENRPDPVSASRFREISAAAGLKRRSATPPAISGPGPSDDATLLWQS